MELEQPSTPRRALRRPLRVELTPPEGLLTRPRFLGYADSVSETGLFIQSMNTRSAGTHLRLRIHVRGQPEPVDCNAEVRWQRPCGGRDRPCAGMDVRLLDLSEESRGVLREFCSSER